MAIDIKKTENGILIEDKFLFNPTEIEIGIINLLPKIGEEMAYDRGNLLSIDFPGEYDIGGSFIKVYAGNGDKLNFLVTYDRGNLLSIDFPGEYDIGGSFIKVYAGNGDKLNFLVTYEGTTFAIIQSPEVLELDEVCDMSTRIFPDESVSKKLDQLEMEGDRINLSKMDEMSFEDATKNTEQEITVDIE